MILFFLILNVLFAVEPSYNYDKTPKDYDLKYKEVQIETKDSMKLNTWIISENENYSDVLIMQSRNTCKCKQCNRLPK